MNKKAFTAEKLRQDKEVINLNKNLKGVKIVWYWACSAFYIHKPFTHVASHDLAPYDKASLRFLPLFMICTWKETLKLWS